MRITLNLATRPYADQGPALKRLRIGMAALAVVLIGLGLGLLHFHQSALQMAAQEDALDQSIAKAEREQRDDQAQMQQPANAKVLTQAEFLNQLFEEKAFSWTACMEDLERVLPAGVQVTAIEPARSKDGRLTLRLRVSGQRERSVEMVRNMEHSQRFVAPRLAGENAENGQQGDLQPVRDLGKVSFDILAEYNPATLDERRQEIAKSKRARSTDAVAPVGPSIRAQQPQYVPPNPQGFQPNPAMGQRSFPRQMQPMPGMRPRGTPFQGPVRNRPPDSSVPPAGGLQ
jgi:type IV pilus assembly protein PilN